MIWEAHRGQTVSEAEVKATLIAHHGHELPLLALQQHSTRHTKQSRRVQTQTDKQIQESELPCMSGRVAAARGGEGPSCSCTYSCRPAESVARTIKRRATSDETPCCEMHTALDTTEEHRCAPPRAQVPGGRGRLGTAEVILAAAAYVQVHLQWPHRIRYV